MKFKINQSFAANYDERRRKEELSKLKSKYGDIPLEEEEGASTTESETDEDWERNVLNDTRDLELLEALKSGDPRIKDPSYRWFSSDSENDFGPSSKASKKEPVNKPLFLRDLERRRLIGGIKEEAMDQDGDQGGEDEGIKACDADLSALKKAFKVNVSDDEDDGETALFTLGKGVTTATISSTDVIIKQTDKNDDEMLLSYIKMIAKKANEPKADNHNSSADDEREDDDSGEEELFFSKGAEFEEQWNNRFSEPTDLENHYPRTFAAFRSEEADRDFIKSHPRKIADSMRQPRDGKLSRSEKNRVRRDRVRREKELKMARIGAELDAKVEAEIRELRRLKMESVEDRVEKIRRTAANGKLQLDVKFLEEDWDPAKHDQMIQRAFDQDYDKNQQEQAKPVFSDDDELDKDLVDWDNWKPSASSSGGGSSSKPQENAAQDLMDVDEEGRAPRSRRRKRRHRAVGFRGALERAYKRGRLANDVGRYSREDFPEGFEEFIDKVYAFDCEDIIPGHGEGQEDVKCRFRYRCTVPNDFGLSVDEILSAPARELNSWASLKKVVQYRTEEEEVRDKKVYCSGRRQMQKGRLLPSVFTPLSDNEGVGDEEEKTEGEAVAQKKKKKKKQKKKVSMAAGGQSSTMEIDAPPEEAGPSELKIFGDEQTQRPRKKAWPSKQKPYIPKATDIVSESRLSKLLRGNKD